MPVGNISLPKSLPEFLRPDAVAEIQRAEDIINSLQDLKLQVNIPDGSVRYGVVQIIGDSAVLIVTL